MFTNVTQCVPTCKHPTVPTCIRPRADFDMIIARREPKLDMVIYLTVYIFYCVLFKLAHCTVYNASLIYLKK